MTKRGVHRGEVRPETGSLPGFTGWEEHSEAGNEAKKLLPEMQGGSHNHGRGSGGRCWRR
jgi:hypothetical protein